MKFEMLANLLDDINGATFIGIDTETSVKLKGGKGNPLQGKVTKKTLGASVMVFTNANSSAYGDMVKRRLVKEGKDPESFELGKRAWGERIKGTPFIEHKEQKYLEAIFLNSGKSEYFVDGIKTPKEDIEGLPVVKVNEESQGGLEDKVIIRTFKVDSIIGMRIDGMEVKVR